MASGKRLNFDFACTRGPFPSLSPLSKSGLTSSSGWLGMHPHKERKQKLAVPVAAVGTHAPFHPTTTVVGGKQISPWNIQESKTIGRDFAQRRPPPALRHLPHTNRLGQAYILVTGRWRTDDGWGEVAIILILFAHLAWPGVPVLDLWRSHRIGR